MHSTKSKQPDCAGWSRAGWQTMTKTYEERGNHSISEFTLCLQPKRAEASSHSPSREKSPRPGLLDLRARGRGQFTAKLKRTNHGWHLWVQPYLKVNVFSFVLGVRRLQVNQLLVNFSALKKTNFRLCCVSMWHHWFNLWDEPTSFQFSDRSDAPASNQCKNKGKKW